MKQLTTIISMVLITTAAARAQPLPDGQPPPPPAHPETLDRGAIAAGMAAVKDRVDACNTTGFVGKITAAVKVAPTGAVTRVTLAGGDKQMADCITSVLQVARFAQSQRGSSFRYPLMMGTPEVVSGDAIATDVAPGDGTAAPPLTPTDPYAGAPETPPAPKVRRPNISMPELLTIPTGFLLPAAVLYSKFSLDTGGGVTSDSRVGLGDVAEFGIATTDAVRDKLEGKDRAQRIQPYVTASFRLGVGENRLFDQQPGITLGFRKSFERKHDNFSTRIAELTLVMSKHIGPNVVIHAGGAFWDASLAGKLDAKIDPEAPDREVAMHEFEDLRRQVRPFGGIEVTPLPRSQILVDLGWGPEFCYTCSDSKAATNPEINPDRAKIRLKPVLSWGVRYHVASFMRLESGVRVPDIGTANLLDAQIFGQVTFTSWALRRGIDAIK